MEITEIRIKLMEEPGERLQAFCSLTFDDAFVVRDLKIIEGLNGPFVAMPSRKLTAHCGNCRCKNHLRAAFCNQCGARLNPDDRVIKDAEGRAKLYADIAHPINSACREMIQARVIEAFHQEQERSKEPGYVSRYDEFDREDVTVRATPTVPLQPAIPAAAVAVVANAPHPAGPHRGRGVAAPAARTESQQAGPHRSIAEEVKPRLPNSPQGGAGGFGAGVF